MSVSTDAYLLFGINIGELSLQELVEKLGIYEEGTDCSEIEDGDCLEALEEELPKTLEIVITTHSEYPEYFIAAKGYKRAWRGYPVLLDSKELLKVTDKARKDLAKISKKLDLAAGYWLASYTDF